MIRSKVRGRRVVPLGILLLGAVVVALWLASGSGLLHGRLPPDTKAQNRSQAEDVAFSVASDAGCGKFNSDLPDVSAASWQYECTIGDVLYRIYVYGDDQARTQGLAELKASGRPYMTKAYYAVSAVPYSGSKGGVLTATPPPKSVMDPFSSH